MQKNFSSFIVVNLVKFGMGRCIGALYTLHLDGRIAVGGTRDSWGTRQSLVSSKVVGFELGRCQIAELVNS